MSTKKDREQRREERIAAEQEANSGDQRTRLLQIAAGTVFVVIIAVVVVIVVAGSGGSSGGDASNIKEVAQVDSLVGKSPQSKLTLGKSSAPVELFEYGDLQCPFCKAYSEEVLPQVIEEKVDSGKANITFRNYLIIGEQSLPAGAGAIAAGEQGRGWNFIETFYRNQGEENSGYVTEAFLESIAKAAGVKNMARWNEERKSKKLLAQAEATTTEASSKLGFTGTPSFAIKGPKSKGLELLSSNEASNSETIEEKIEEVS
jgi:protein-disulfide isomerase